MAGHDSCGRTAGFPLRLIRGLSRPSTALSMPCPSLAVLLLSVVGPFTTTCFRVAMNATVVQRFEFDIIIGFSHDIYPLIYPFAFAHVDPGIRNYCFQTMPFPKTLPPTLELYNGVDATKMLKLFGVYAGILVFYPDCEKRENIWTPESGESLQAHASLCSQQARRSKLWQKCSHLSQVPIIRNSTFLHNAIPSPAS